MEMGRRDAEEGEVVEEQEEVAEVASQDGGRKRVEN